VRKVPKILAMLKFYLAQGDQVLSKIILNNVQINNNTVLNTLAQNSQGEWYSAHNGMSYRKGTRHHETRYK